jgi:NADPH:quinone reductase-like Zn-dependent oxidoreductase
MLHFRQRDCFEFHRNLESLSTRQQLVGYGWKEHSMKRFVGDAKDAAPNGLSRPSISISGNSMRAARIHRHGGPEVLRVEEVPIPTPGPGQVRVRVAASGVNPLDWKVREGWVKEIPPLPLPFTLGSDLSGIVDRVGPGARRFRSGDAVIGRAHRFCGGTFADYVVISETDLVAKPRGISHLEAAALPVAGLAAHAAIIGQRGLRAGERVLILGGAGGVGHIAVQLSKISGAWVAATASRQNLEFLLSLGADLAIERDRSDLTVLLKPVDVVVDTVGSMALNPAWAVLKRNGRVRSTVSPPLASESRLARDIAFVSGSPTGPVLTELADLVYAGQVRLEIPRVFSLAQVDRALALSESGHARGKIVLSMHDL